jgi:gluconolactonase
MVEESAGIAGNRAADPRADSVFFDPTGLISPFAFGKFDTAALLSPLTNTFPPFTEGPAVDKNGDIFFTDQPNDKIYKYEVATGDLTLFKTGIGRSNGMAFDKDGNLIACADMYGEVWKISPNGTHQVIAKDYNGKRLNGPNDVWINPVTGGLYITDPLFPRGYWDPNDPRRINNFKFNPVTNTYTGDQIWPPVHSEQGPAKSGHVYYLAPGSQSLVRVTTMQEWDADSWPNGIVGTPNGKKLYVNKWAGDNMGGTWEFDINADGTLSKPKKFVDMGGDGMSMDARGNVYVSNGLGVTAFNKSGVRVLNIPAGGGTNNVFGGKDNKTLFMTGTFSRRLTPTTPRRQFGYLYQLEMNVKGVEQFK